MLLLALTLPVSTHALGVKLCEIELSEADQRVFASSPRELTTRRVRDLPREFRLKLMPRLGRPSYHGPHYDISVLGRFDRREVNAAVVVIRLRELLNHVYAQLAANHLTPPHRNHFVVELNPNEFKHLNWRAGPVRMIDDDGLRVRRLGRWWRALGANSKDSYVLLPFDAVGGPLLNRFAIAHELAHDVLEFPEGMIGEAVADHLAWIMTGEHQAWNFTEDRPSLTSDFERMRAVAWDQPLPAPAAPRIALPARLELLRNLREPVIGHVIELSPEIGDFHVNSEMFAALFLSLERRLGRTQILDLLRFLASRARSFEYGAADPHAMTINQFLSQSYDVAKLIRRWAGERGFVVDPSLRQRGL